MTEMMKRFFNELLDSQTLAAAQRYIQQNLDAVETAMREPLLLLRSLQFSQLNPNGTLAELTDIDSVSLQAFTSFVHLLELSADNPNLLAKTVCAIKAYAGRDQHELELSKRWRDVLINMRDYQDLAPIKRQAQMQLGHHRDHMSYSLQILFLQILACTDLQAATARLDIAMGNMLVLPAANQQPNMSRIFPAMRRNFMRTALAAQTFWREVFTNWLNSKMIDEVKTGIIIALKQGSDGSIPEEIPEIIRDLLVSILRMKDLHEIRLALATALEDHDQLTKLSHEVAQESDLMATQAAKDHRNAS
jgi:hypothetical protein